MAVARVAAAPSKARSTHPNSMPLSQEGQKASRVAGSVLTNKPHAHDASRSQNPERLPPEKLVALRNEGQRYLSETFWRKKDYQKAHQLLTQAAEHGDAQAQYDVGVMHQEGWGVTVDLRIARSWYKRAAHQGHASALFCIGRIYFEGLGVARDQTRARRYLKKSADQGNAQAQNLLGTCYECGIGGESDLSRARKQYKKAASQGIAEAQYNLGCMYYFGHGGVRDYAKTCLYLQLSAKQGYTEAQDLLNGIHKFGFGDDLPEHLKFKGKGAGDSVESDSNPVTPKASLLSNTQRADRGLIDRGPVAMAKPISEKTPTIPPEEIPRAAESSDPPRQHLANPENAPAAPKAREEGAGGADLSCLHGRSEDILEGAEHTAARRAKQEELRSIKEDARIDDYYGTFLQSFNHIIKACEVAKTKILGKAKTTPVTSTLDAASDFVSAADSVIDIAIDAGIDVIESLPLVGTLIHIVKVALDAYSNIERRRAVVAAAIFFTSDMERQSTSEILARKLALAQAKELQRMPHSALGQNKKSIALAEKHCGALLEAIMKGKLKPRIDSEDIPKLMRVILGPKFKMQNPDLTSLTPRVRIRPGPENARSGPQLGAGGSVSARTKRSASLGAESASNTGPIPDSTGSRSRIDLEDNVRRLEEIQRSQERQLKEQEDMIRRLHEEGQRRKAELDEHARMMTAFRQALPTDRFSSAGCTGYQDQLQVSADAGAGADMGIPYRDLSQNVAQMDIRLRQLEISKATEEEHRGISPAGRGDFHEPVRGAREKLLGIVPKRGIQ